LNSFSQQGTVKDSIVSIKTPIARLIIKDLINGDSNKEQVRELNTQIKLYLQKFEIKQEEINTLNSKINNFQNIIAIKDEQFRLQRELTDSLVKELKGEKRKIFLYKVGTVVGGIGTFLMLVK
jgi:hypothetical protein